MQLLILDELCQGDMKEKKGCGAGGGGVCATGPRTSRCRSTKLNDLWGSKGVKSLLIAVMDQAPANGTCGPEPEKLYVAKTRKQ